MDIKILNDITLQASHKKHHFLSQQCINQPPDWANDNKHVCLPWPVATGALAGFASTSVPSYESAGQLSSRDWACFCVWGGLLLVQRCLLEQWKNCSIPFYPPPASQPRHAVMVWAEEWGPEPAQCQWHLAVFGLHHVCQQQSAAVPVPGLPAEIRGRGLEPGEVANLAALYASHRQCPYFCHSPCHCKEPRDFSGVRNNWYNWCNKNQCSFRYW